MEMPTTTGRKLALFLSVVLIIAGLMTLAPDMWFLGDPACHVCHEAQYPNDHLLYRNNYLGYNSMCSFAPVSTVILAGLGVIIFATAFRFRFERWGKDYRRIGAAFCLALAVITVLPLNMPYSNLIGGYTLDPFVPLSTAFLAGLAVVVYSGVMVCPFLMFWRSRCPALEHTQDSWQSPHRSINRLVKLALTGNLNAGDIKSLYSCTLCNGCFLAPVQRLTREKAVRKGIVPPHLAMIRDAVASAGNAYGVLADGGRADAGSPCDTLLFVGCTSRYRTPEIVAAAKKLLDARGIRYYTMADETCCGYTMYNLGDLASAGRAIDANIAKFKAAGVKRIITVCPGCYEAFEKLYRGRDGFAPGVTLALDLMKDAKVEEKDVVIHDSCHAKGREDLVRAIVAHAGEGSTGGCCGAGGGLISWDRLIAEHRAKTMARESGSGKKVVTYCPLCYLNFKRADPECVADIYVLMAAQGNSEASKTS
ncbi:MAG: CoB--CoM heterodisulfide reductase iron-sulfur subunit D [Methanocella sp. PtaU1.Bin125]|nr:MAG: CoB--CoM heterodisulfide reductase iron-sulfur subunit D [Methanocella sp. PtaU1.Bin125]